MAQGQQYQAGETPNQMQDDGRMGQGPTNKETDDGSKYQDEWLLIARDAYNESESYYDANIRSTHERNLAHFQNRHAPGSKYYTEGYKFRKKAFRPKTRNRLPVPPNPAVKHSPIRADGAACYLPSRSRPTEGATGAG